MTVYTVYGSAVNVTWTSGKNLTSYRISSSHSFLTGRPRKSSIGNNPESPGILPGVVPGGYQRSRSRLGGSQPGSRSTSPTSLRSYQTYFDSSSPLGNVSSTVRRTCQPTYTSAILHNFTFVSDGSSPIVWNTTKYQLFQRAESHQRSLQWRHV